MQHPSWGRYPYASQVPLPVFWKHQVADVVPEDSKVLPYGMGRSYGDVCLNDGGSLLTTRNLNRMIHFDDQQGVLHAEAGVSLAEVLDFCVPRGWFPPVTPGTKFVTLGGMVANDVHGKNHHHQGSFGHFLLHLGLWRSDTGASHCSSTENPELFKATIGGLGLTGLITDVAFQLLPITGNQMSVETLPFKTLSQFQELTESSDQGFQYTVSWVDTSQFRRGQCRGIFIRGNHADLGSLKAPSRSLTIPFTMPSWLLNRPVLRMFNTAYFHLHALRSAPQNQHLDPFFYPLDRLHHWNRLYGKIGPLQYQCVVPDLDALQPIFKMIGGARQVSFLSVLKKFGNSIPAGFLSFPREGYTLAMDFQITPEVFQLCQCLDAYVESVGGAVYPAKDARMTGKSFEVFFPNHPKWRAWIDPVFSSSFYRRMTQPPTKEKPL